MSSAAPVTLAASLLDALGALDTCAVANAIEQTGTRLRNEGFTTGGIARMAGPSAPLVGYALPIAIRSADPPLRDAIRARHGIERTDWWDALLALPSPRVLVIEDRDQATGTGAFVGEVHAHVLRALGCVGVVTNGAVRDADALDALGFHAFARQLAVSHAYVQVTSIGQPVRIAGLAVQRGDLLHGDRHGIVQIPAAVAAGIPHIAAQLRARERAVIDYCRTPGGTHEGLRQLLASAHD